MGRVPQHAQSPAAEGCGRGLTWLGHHGGDTDAALHGTVISLKFRPGIGPVAHQCRVTDLEGLKGFGLGVIGDGPCADSSVDQVFHPGRGLTGRQAVEARLSTDRIDPGATERLEHFNKIAAEAFVLTALPDKPLRCLTVLLELAHHSCQFIRRRRWMGHQVCSPVQQADIGTQWPAVQGLIHPIAEPSSRHQLLFISGVEPRIKGFQPSGGHILRQPGHIH